MTATSRLSNAESVTVPTREAEHRLDQVAAEKQVVSARAYRARTATRFTVNAAAFDDAVSGETGAADERFASTFSSVYERENPASRPTGAGHPAACHPHDP